MANLLSDGSVPLTADWDIGSGRAILARAVKARDTNGVSLLTSNGSFYLELNNNGDVLLSTGKHLSVREVRALDSNGLNLYNLAGNEGITIDNSGNVSVTEALTVSGVATFNGRVVAPGTAAIGEATEIAEANAAVVRVGDVDNDWGDYARFIGAGDCGRFIWGDWDNMSSSTPKSIVFSGSAYKPAKGVTAWGLVHNVTAGTMGRFDVGPVLINTTNTLYDGGGGKTAVLSVASNGAVTLYKTGSDTLDIVYFIMWL